MLSSYDALERVATQPSLEGKPEQDRVNWWMYDPKVIGEWVVSGAREQASRLRGDTPAEVFATQARRGIATARERLARDDPVCSPFFGTVRLGEFVATRVVEVAVHAMDLCHALGLDSAPTPDALRITVDVLQRLLGAEPPLDDTRFVLIGTGRAAPTEPERNALGPLAAKLPLFA